MQNLNFLTKCSLDKFSEIKVSQFTMSLEGAGSLLRYISSEVTRSYMLEHDQERYTTKREKMYTFMRIPRLVGDGLEQV